MSSFRCCGIGSTSAPAASAHSVRTNWKDAFLTYYPNITHIVLCLDNDEAGRTRTQDIIKHLEGSGKTVEDRPPPIGKDYNDTLVQVTQEYQKHCISLDDILEETR